MSDTRTIPQREAEGYPWIGCECCKGTVWVPFKMIRDRIPTPNGKPLLTLKDAAAYIMKLPKNVSAAEHWQVAFEQLIDAAEGRNFIMHARIGMLRALNHGKPQAVTSRRKRTKAYRIVG